MTRKYFHITVFLGNDTMQDAEDAQEAINRAFECYGDRETRILDKNGNRVGTLSLEVVYD